MAGWFSKQKQAATEGSTAIQAQGDVVIHQGVTAAEARQIALDVFRSNLLEYRGVAMGVAARRGEALTDSFLDKLQKENPVGLDQAQHPGFQDDLFVAQKEYAKAGEKELGDLLVDLLVDRSKEIQRTTLQIVLSESIRVAPKLTQAQTNTLSLVFLCRYVFNQSPTLEGVSAHLRACLGPIAGAYTIAHTAFSHLVFAGCGNLVQISVWNMRSMWTSLYKGLLQKGLDQAQVDAANLPVEIRKRYVGPCMSDPTKFQVLILGDQTLTEIADKHADVRPHKAALQMLLDQGMADQAQVNAKLDSLAPFMPKIFADWESSNLKSFDLTSVGIAIAHANIKRFAGEFARLSTWIE
jgi:hypothetical protein